MPTQTEVLRDTASFHVGSVVVPENPYESKCGLCGAQIHFRQPLTDWTKVYCPGCGEYIAVR
jgi:predicted RNA-binding Zn-ribbon protein involved in translation (DUF1610 family)